MEKILRYSNGIRAVVESLPVHSVSVGIWTNAGASKENAGNNGISHFLEHMMFKGTKTLNAYDIAKSFENVGAAVNAFTSKDCTCYYVKTVTEFTEKCFDLLSHIYLESEFPEEEIDRERNVVIEEINMTSDSPEDLCYDLLSEALFDGPLAQTILGPVDNIKRFGKCDIIDYMNTHYCSKNIVIAFAGEITPEEADKLVRKYFLPRFNIQGNCAERESNAYASKKIVKIDDYEQANLCIGFPSLSFNDKQMNVQSLLSAILGSSMSSRLFQQIRERLGLAYSIYTTPSVYINAGSFNICANYTATNTKKVIDNIRSEIDLLIDKGVTKEEFERAKAQVKASLVFMQENVQSQMISFGKLMLLCDELFDMKTRLSNVNAVTIKDVNEFARKLFSAKPAIAYLGKAPDANPDWI